MSLSLVAGKTKTYNEYKFHVFGPPSFSLCVNPRCCQTETRNYTILVINYSVIVNFYSENIWSQRQKASNVFVIKIKKDSVESVKHINKI